MTYQEVMQRGTLENGNRLIERLDPRTLVGEPTYIFNIYSCEFTQNRGTLGGLFYIPPCPEGKEYVRAPQAIEGTVADTYPHFTDQEVFRARPVPGEDVVHMVLGIASGNTKDEDIRRFGVFASKNEVPTKQELAKAKQILVTELQRQVQEADRLSTAADPQMRDSAQNEKFYKAARYLNVKKSWLSEAAEMTLCPFCSIGVRPEASICHGCHQVINQAAFEATQKKIGASA